MLHSDINALLAFNCLLLSSQSLERRGNTTFCLLVLKFFRFFVLVGGVFFLPSENQVFFSLLNGIT